MDGVFGEEMGTDEAIVALRPATKGLSEASKDLFELTRLGELAGVHNSLLALSLDAKATDVVTMRDGLGMTLLHWAAREGHLQLVKYLVFEANSDVLARCHRGLKPAQHAREQVNPPC